MKAWGVKRVSGKAAAWTQMVAWPNEIGCAIPFFTHRHDARIFKNRHIKSMRSELQIVPVEIPDP